MSRNIAFPVIAFVVALFSAGIAYAAFADKIKIKSAIFTTGSAEIKFLVNLAGDTQTENIADEITGPNFTNIGSNWQNDYAVKIFNNSTSAIDLGSNAYYETINDPDELRSYINVELIPWDDTNNNGLVETDELGTTYGKKTITKWKTEGFALGELNAGQIKGLLLRFSTTTLSDTKQGKTGMFDFEFESVNK